MFIQNINNPSEVFSLFHVNEYEYEKIKSKLPLLNNYNIRLNSEQENSAFSAYLMTNNKNEISFLTKDKIESNEYVLCTSSANTDNVLCPLSYLPEIDEIIGQHQDDDISDYDFIIICVDKISSLLEDKNAEAFLDHIISGKPKEEFKTFFVRESIKNTIDSLIHDYISSRPVKIIETELENKIKDCKERVGNELAAHKDTNILIRVDEEYACVFAKDLSVIETLQKEYGGFSSSFDNAWIGQGDVKDIEKVVTHRNNVLTEAKNELENSFFYKDDCVAIRCDNAEILRKLNSNFHKFNPILKENGWACMCQPYDAKKIKDFLLSEYVNILYENDINVEIPEENRGKETVFYTPKVKEMLNNIDSPEKNKDNNIVQKDDPIL